MGIGATQKDRDPATPLVGLRRVVRVLIGQANAPAIGARRLISSLTALARNAPHQRLIGRSRRSLLRNLLSQPAGYSDRAISTARQ